MCLSFRLSLLIFCQFIGIVFAQNRAVHMLNTSLLEAEKPVALEIVVFKPEGSGPFPTLVFNHGSVNNGNDPKEVGYTVSYPELASFYNEMGWAVVIPQRRGRGKSEGRYAEGWEASRGRYSCDPAVAAASMARAMQDLDEINKYLSSRTDLDTQRMLIGGHSKGGILAMAFAARHPERYLGVVNFVGGWVGERCETVSEINNSTFAKTASYKKPTLWLYGQNDPFYSIAHSKSSFDAFVAAGGKGTFEVLTLGFLRNDHQIIRNKSVWEAAITSYLKLLEK